MKSAALNHRLLLVSALAGIVLAVVITAVVRDPKSALTLPLPAPVALPTETDTPSSRIPLEVNRPTAGPTGDYVLVPQGARNVMPGNIAPGMPLITEL